MAQILAKRWEHVLNVDIYLISKKRRQTLSSSHVEKKTEEHFAKNISS
ncbi:MAG: hypothetical protein ABSD41_10475 [Candidatus Bathyarchaeia archaeon]